MLYLLLYDRILIFRFLLSNVDKPRKALNGFLVLVYVISLGMCGITTIIPTTIIITTTTATIITINTTTTINTTAENTITITTTATITYTTYITTITTNHTSMTITTTTTIIITITTTITTTTTTTGNIDQVLEFSSQDRLGGNGYKVEKFRFRTDIGRYWFTNRVVNNWNRLDRYVVSGESMGSFKRRLDPSMDRHERWDG